MTVRGGLSSLASFSTSSISDCTQSLALPLMMRQSTILTVLSVLFLPVLASPMLVDNPLDNRTYTGNVRRLFDCLDVPILITGPPREHGSILVWVHVVRRIPTPMPLSPSQSACIAREAIVAMWVSFRVLYHHLIPFLSGSVSRTPRTGRQHTA